MIKCAVQSKKAKTAIFYFTASGFNVLLTTELKVYKALEGNVKMLQGAFPRFGHYPII